jgi:fumarylacetoacetate (FAA) hydrolase family protein
MNIDILDRDIGYYIDAKFDSLKDVEVESDGHGGIKLETVNDLQVTQTATVCLSRSLVERIIEQYEKQNPRIVQSWCQCQSGKIGDYREENQCTCGISKHHYHCPVCGGVTQIG